MMNKRQNRRAAPRSTRDPVRPHLHRIVAVVVAVLTLAACGVDEEPADDATPTPDQTEIGEQATEEPADESGTPDQPEGVEDPAAGLDADGLGILTGRIDGSVDDAVAAVEDALADVPIELLFRVDHAQGAEEVELELPATRLLAFSDPELDTLLLQEEPLMGLDLPAKLLIWDDDGTTRAGVNEPPFLAQRYDLDPDVQPLAALDELQRDLLEVVGATDVPAGLNPVAAPEGVAVLDSDDGFDATVARAREAIEDAGPALVAEVDHAASAEGVGMELAGNTLFVFGDPELGTPLMASERTAGIDLPQKLLVYDDEGRTRVAYNEPAYLEERHLLAGVDEPLESVGDALAGLAAAAASAG